MASDSSSEEEVRDRRRKVLKQEQKRGSEIEELFEESTSSESEGEFVVEEDKGRRRQERDVYEDSENAGILYEIFGDGTDYAYLLEEEGSGEEEGEGEEKEKEKAEGKKGEKEEGQGEGEERAEAIDEFGVQWITERLREEHDTSECAERLPALVKLVWSRVPVPVVFTAHPDLCGYPITLTHLYRIEDHCNAFANLKILRGRIPSLPAEDEGGQSGLPPLSLLVEDLENIVNHKPSTAPSTFSFPFSFSFTLSPSQLTSNLLSNKMAHFPPSPPSTPTDDSLLSEIADAFSKDPGIKKTFFSISFGTTVEAETRKNLSAISPPEYLHLLDKSTSNGNGKLSLSLNTESIVSAILPLFTTDDQWSSARHTVLTKTLGKMEGYLAERAEKKKRDEALRHLSAEVFFVLCGRSFFGAANPKREAGRHIFGIFSGDAEAGGKHMACAVIGDATEEILEISPADPASLSPFISKYKPMVIGVTGKGYRVAKFFRYATRALELSGEEAQVLYVDNDTPSLFFSGNSPLSPYDAAALATARKLREPTYEYIALFLSHSLHAISFHPLQHLLSPSSLYLTFRRALTTSLLLAGMPLSDLGRPEAQLTLPFFLRSSLPPEGLFSREGVRSRLRAVDAPDLSVFFRSSEDPLDNTLIHPSLYQYTREYLSSFSSSSDRDQKVSLTKELREKLTHSHPRTPKDTFITEALTLHIRRPFRGISNKTLFHIFWTPPPGEADAVVTKILPTGVLLSTEGIPSFHREEVPDVEIYKYKVNQAVRVKVLSISYERMSLLVDILNPKPCDLKKPKFADSPFYRNVGSREAEAELKDRGVGAFILRASRKERDTAIITLKLGDGICTHIKVREEGGDSPVYTVDDETYSQIDEVVSIYILGYLRVLKAASKHPKFVHSEEQGLSKTDSIPYSFSLSRRFPGRISFKYVPGRTTREELLVIKRQGLLYNNRVFRDLNDFVTYFKKRGGGHTHAYT